MTTKQVLKKIKEMIKKDGVPFMLRRAEELLNSGGIEKSKFENNFILPKIILHCVLSEVANQYKPLDHEQEIGNLKHF